MSSRYDQLDRVLGQLTAGLIALKNWHPRKVELLQRNRLEELEALNAREYAHMAQLEALNLERSRLHAELAEEVGLPALAPLSRLLERLPEAARRQLRHRWQELDAAGRRLKDLQVTPNVMVRRAASRIEATIQAVAEVSAAQETAGRSPVGFDAQPVSSWMVNRTA
ncbi:MAG: flagellar export chaperone FlgN [Candidatus Sericytochromatia bacterium]|nr:flagellar export chaperone FlgN [Candidatus Sericytochromatia bacterium]